MITFFSMPKPFRGHINVIQRNAIQSWRRLDPQVEIILFGMEEGTQEVCRELGLRQERRIERNDLGTPLLNDLFCRVQQLARFDLLCFSNCDIIHTQQFTMAIRRVCEWRDKFLMVGRRCDLNLTEPVDFSHPEWEPRLLELARLRGKPRTWEWIDYFVFRRGLFAEMPAFALGRPIYDDWMIWKVRTSGVPVVDATPSVMAIHQNHDYAHHPQGQKGVWHGEEFRRNLELAGGWRHVNTIEDATHLLEPDSIRRIFRHWPVQVRREWKFFFTAVLDRTRPLRGRLGLRRESLARLFGAGSQEAGERKP